MIDCPKCKVRMHKKQTATVDVDECPTCRGVWFTRSQLEEAKDAVDEELNWLEFQIWQDGSAIKNAGHGVQCPVCGGKTVGLTCGHTGVSVDYCEACQGAWLDKGEFEGIVAALENEVNSASLSDYAKATVEEAREVLRGPGSLVSEWKDFATVIRLLKYRLFVEHPEAVKAVLSIYRAVH